MNSFKVLEGKMITKAELVRSAMNDDIGRLRLDFTQHLTNFDFALVCPVHGFNQSL
jgi:hypothetical protein